MRHVAKAALLAAIVVLIPNLAQAQSLAGTVRDASSAVLPGVTVEAASPGFDREGPHDCVGRHGPVPNPGPHSRDLQIDVHAARLHDRDSRGGRGQRRRKQHHDQRGDARRWRAGDDYRDRRDAGGGRPDQHAHAEGDRQRGHRGDSGVARIRQHPRDRAWHPGDRAQFRREPGDELLHRARRPRQRRYCADRWHERRLGVQRRRRGRLRLRHRERAGNPGDDRRWPR